MTESRNRPNENEVIQPVVSPRSLSGPEQKRIAELAFVSFAIKLTFGAGFGICFLMFLSGFKTGTFPQVAEYIQLWKEFLPVITLEFGYAFGKKS